PAHPLITAKLRDVESQAGGYVADGFATPPVAEIDPDAIEEELHVDSGGTQNIDVDELEELDPDALAEMIEDHELLEEPAVPDVAPVAHAKPAVMLEKPIEDNDAETHYDLGLAYKEMGLWDEAIKAFDKVMANPAREVQCRLMIGLCRRDQGNPSEAVHSFKAALHAPQVNEREKLGLLYEIGITYEAMGDAREALYYFEGVLKRDAAFLDVADRVA
ncbi:MAG: tetratricopeptide repeat protein, partial [Gemmatimonadetes bacterium]|nr:tetratricopeptide repeat protein [Gemmatimonadota bacterium]